MCAKAKLNFMGNKFDRLAIEVDCMDKLLSFRSNASMVVYFVLPCSAKLHLSKSCKDATKFGFRKNLYMHRNNVNTCFETQITYLTTKHGNTLRKQLSAPISSDRYSPSHSQAIINAYKWVKMAKTAECGGLPEMRMKSLNGIANDDSLTSDRSSPPSGRNN